MYGTTDPRTDTERLLGILKSHGIPDSAIREVDGRVWVHRVISESHDHTNITMDNVWQWLERREK